MKTRLLGVLFIATLTVENCFAMSFDTEPEYVQRYVTKQLVSAVKANNRFVIVYGKKPSVWLNDPPMDKAGGISFSEARLLDLSLGSASSVESLKGNISARVDGCALFYDMSPIYDYSSRQNDNARIHYFPDMGPDRMCRLVCVQPQQEPVKNRIIEDANSDSDDYAKNMQFVSDARTLPSAEFLAKHKLAQVFSNSVYAITEGCIFGVNHPKFNVPDEEAKDHHRRKRTVFLSHQEVSEIVYLAYVHEDARGGAAKYAEAMKRSQVLKPMEEGPPRRNTATPPQEGNPATPFEKGAFKTLIGKRLHEALTDPNYGLEERLAKEAKEKEKREQAER